MCGSNLAIENFAEKPTVPNQNSRDSVLAFLRFERAWVNKETFGLFSEALPCATPINLKMVLWDWFKKKK